MSGRSRPEPPRHLSRRLSRRPPVQRIAAPPHQERRRLQSEHSARSAAEKIRTARTRGQKRIQKPRSGQQMRPMPHVRDQRLVAITQRVPADQYGRHCPLHVWAQRRSETHVSPSFAPNSDRKLSTPVSSVRLTTHAPAHEATELRALVTADACTRSALLRSTNVDGVNSPSTAAGMPFAATSGAESTHNDTSDVETLRESRQAQAKQNRISEVQL